ncbi:MAG: hypothetical protein K2R98_28295 [Gemmataceae bacterium]|nr:hypothetical protein [Gemmataceae bacterium]
MTDGPLPTDFPTHHYDQAKAELRDSIADLRRIAAGGAFKRGDRRLARLACNVLALEMIVAQGREEE